MTNEDISPTWAGMQKSGGVIEKEIVFSAREGMISDRMSGLVLKGSLAVVDIEVLEEETTVYNFEVEDDHTYFVTDAEVWVHNADEGYILKIDLVGVGGLNAAHSAKNKYLSGKKTNEEKEEYDEEMIAIQSGKYLTTFESLKKTFTNGLNIVKDNILSPIGNGFVSLGSTIGNGILNIGSAIGSGMSYIAQGFTNAIFPHQSERIPVESVETVEVALSLSDEVGLKKGNPANKEKQDGEIVPIGSESNKLVSVKSATEFETDAKILPGIEELLQKQESLGYGVTLDVSSRIKDAFKAYVLTSFTILMSHQKGERIDLIDAYRKNGNKIYTAPDELANKLKIKGSISVDEVNAEDGSMTKILNEQLSKGKPAAVYFRTPAVFPKRDKNGNSYMDREYHMEVVIGTATVGGQRVFKLYDVGYQNDLYLDPKNGRPFKFVDGRQEYTKSNKHDRSTYKIWRYK